MQNISHQPKTVPPAKSVLPAPSPPVNLSQPSAELIASRTSADTATVRQIMTALAGGSIRRQIIAGNEVAVYGLMHYTLEEIGSIYFGATNTDEAVFPEMVRFTMDHFAHLAPEEIREAFRLHAAGKLGTEKEAYRGLFTVNMLGAILGHYDGYRQNIACEIAREEMRMDGERIQREKAEANKDFDKDRAMRENLERWKQTGPPALKDFPIGPMFFDWLYKNGMINPTEQERKATLYNAAQIEIERLQDEIAGMTNASRATIQDKRDRIAKLAGEMTAENREYLKNTAKRLAALAWLKNQHHG
jgi:hypothetical protein